MKQRSLRDLVKAGTDADIVANLTVCAARLRMASDGVPIEKFDDFVGISAQRIAAYAASQLEAMPTSLRTDIEQFAWRTRNVFEAFLILLYTTSSALNAKEFVAQRIGDERSILQGIVSLAHGASGNIEPVRDRIKQCDTVLYRHGFSKAPPWRIDQLAKEVGLSDDYAVFYKLYSKYVHPSGWTIIAEATEVNDATYWEAFIVNAQFYANSCLGAIERLTSSRLSPGVQGG